MRRREPRPLAAALADVTAGASPATLLARVQSVWPGVAGRVLAAEASPVAEHGTEVRVACRTASWAHELELMEPDLRERLNEALGGSPEGPVTALRFRYAASAGGPGDTRL